ncbi:MAG: adenine phosphoribosyltransferase [Ilumatobacteraceae bacterium]|jgi:adenine phosphoribosyltransferase|nr:adenine phosphoribosyltransferase [Ilumatobacteraceae bacterium]MDP4705258.1 adenine phosphoribosyltransferase [Ilumatobacteraceae bacterium]MDP4713315.1 adenine phosphoribosyltransferase [Ilumatobacteraceae bacterium]MDP4936588.1 adenine phosphoribosyltransferase [Ilumatobacteraceae bacterium]MDP4976564.1 adenine phosphoribosyltransferase [Ilumatobacteraceae bacterium]
MQDFIRSIPDYPNPGVTFRDITPLLGDGPAFAEAISTLADRFTGANIQRVIGVEARGFILGAPIAVALGAGFVPVRKAGKLPWAVVREEYDLEYGSDKLEIHRDAIHPGERILVVDDVLATGGTAAATCRLVSALGGDIVALAVLIELPFLEGRAKLAGITVESLFTY